MFKFHYLTFLLVENAFNVFLLIANTSFICLDEKFAIFTESEKDVGFLQRT